MNITEQLRKIIASTCKCNFSADQLRDSSIECAPSVPDSVTYQTHLLGTAQIRGSSIIDSLKRNFVIKERFEVQYWTLSLQKFCIIVSNKEPFCVENPPVNIELIIGAVGGTVIVVLLVVVTSITVMLWTKARRKKANASNVNM